jgi:hypothetical protein
LGAPCADDSGLARRISASRSHVLGLLMRFAWPPARMPSADQISVNSPHSAMPWHEWVALIAESTGSAQRAVRPSQLAHRASTPARPRSRHECDGFLAALPSAIMPPPFLLLMASVTAATFVGRRANNLADAWFHGSWHAKTPTGYRSFRSISSLRSCTVRSTMADISTCHDLFWRHHDQA